MQPGSLCIYDAPLNCKSIRNDITFFEIPFAKLAAELATDARLRKLLTNMIYVANRLSDKVTVIDGRTNQSVQR